MKLSLLCLVAFVAVALALPSMYSENEYEYLFSRWVARHQKSYHPDEAHYRFQVWKENLDKITRHNMKNLGWKQGMNEFGDMTWEEFRLNKLGYNHRINTFRRSRNAPARWTLSLPESVDWRMKNAVSPVKNQGNCGSCWTFSTAGAIEGICAIKTGQLMSLAEQELVDCAGDKYGNAGCRGGMMDGGFQYAIDTKGLAVEGDYPYTAVEGKCAASGKKHQCVVTGFKDVAQNDEMALKEAVAMQPVAVAIEADQDGFQFYTHGVFDGECGTNLDHGVLLVGYGEEDGKKYWIVKNSWGNTWGDHGYIKLLRAESSGNPGQCGIAMSASYPTM